MYFNIWIIHMYVLSGVLKKKKFYLILNKI